MTERADLIARAAEVIRSVTGLNSDETWAVVADTNAHGIACALADDGVLAEPEEMAEIHIDGGLVEVTEAVAAEVKRLRARIHEVAHEEQMRSGKLQSILDDRENTAAYAKKVFKDHGGDFGFSSAIGRAIVISLIQERDALQAHIDAVESLCSYWEANPAVEWTAGDAADAVRAALAGEGPG
jgi:hypothetical protein